jgi:endonuclease III
MDAHNPKGVTPGLALRFRMRALLLLAMAVLLRHSHCFRSISRSPSLQLVKRLHSNAVQHDELASSAAAVAPPQWEEQLAGIRLMRTGQSAAVDISGAGAIKEEVKKYRPAVSSADLRFAVLISGILSSQTRDANTSAACRALRELCHPEALSAAALSKFSEDEIAIAIRPASFYKTKAVRLKQLCEILLAEYDGDIPPTPKGLLALPGVGPKVMTLIMDLAWDDVHGICVDTHVHRIANRLVGSSLNDSTNLMHQCCTYAQRQC